MIDVTELATHLCRDGVKVPKGLERGDLDKDDEGIPRALSTLQLTVSWETKSFHDLHAIRIVDGTAMGLDGVTVVPCKMRQNHVADGCQQRASESVVHDTDH